jgi:hypothetical protein
MIDFPYYLLAEWLCFVTSILLLKKTSHHFWFGVKPYLLLVVINETFCYYLAWILKTNNQLYYNLFTPVEFIFAIWIISKIIISHNFRYVFGISYAVFFFSFIAEWSVKRTLTVYFDKADTIGSVIVICLCIYYYYGLFEQDAYVNLLNDPSFWFVSGYFLFYTTSISADTFFDQFVIMWAKHLAPVRHIIMDIINIILYGCWIKSFICQRIKQE